MFLKKKLSPHLCRNGLHGLNQADQQLNGTGRVESHLSIVVNDMEYLHIILLDLYKLCSIYESLFN